MMRIEYKELNKLIVKNHYPLSRIDDLFDPRQGASWFSQIHLQLGYHLIRVKYEDVQKKAFKTCYG